MTTPAGWYDDGSGRQRWWDGQQWTEHFAPEVAAPASSEAQESHEATLVEQVPAVDETPAAAEAPVVPETSVAPDHSVPSDSSVPSDFSVPADHSVPSDHSGPSVDSAASSSSDVVEDTVVAPAAAPEWAAPAQTPTTPLGDSGYPGAAPAAPPVPPVPPIGTAPAYPGAAAPAYPAAPGAYSSAPAAYAAPGAYAAGGYPASAPYAPAAPTEPKKLSVVGLVGLGLAALGTILSFIPVTLPFAWILLAAGFIVSLISLFLKGKKWPGITGLGLSILGSIIALIMGFVFLFAFANQIEDSIPDPLPTSSSDGSEEGTDDGTAPTEVAEGSLGEPVVVEQLSGAGEVTINSAAWSATNDSGFDPTNGGYLVIDLTWVGTEGTSYVNPLYFSVETAEGTAGDFDIFGDATLEAGEIEAGATSEGTVSFDVAQSASYDVIITNELMQEVARVTVEPSAG